MLNLLFSPNGAIGTRQLLVGGIILIIVNVLFGLLPLIIKDPTTLQLASLPSYVLLYCWVVLWIKRYRGAGKAGSWCLLPIGVYILIAILASIILFWQPFLDMMEVGMEDPGNEAAMNAAFGIGTVEMTIKGILMSIITSGLVLGLFAYLIKGEPEDRSVDVFD